MNLLFISQYTLTVDFVLLFYLDQFQVMLILFNNLLEIKEALLDGQLDHFFMTFLLMILLFVN